MTLWDDLTITRARRGDEVVYLVRNPGTGEVLEFGELEYVILSQLSRYRRSTAIRRELRDRNGAGISGQSLSAFLRVVERRGLVVRMPTPYGATTERPGPRSTQAPGAGAGRAGASPGSHPHWYLSGYSLGSTQGDQTSAAAVFFATYVYDPYNSSRVRVNVECSGSQSSITPRQLLRV